MRSLLNQTITVQRANLSTGTTPTFAGTVAAADPTTIMALSKEGVTVSFLIYTTEDPLAVVGDVILAAGISYTVVAPARDPSSTRA